LTEVETLNIKISVMVNYIFKTGFRI